MGGFIKSGSAKMRAEGVQKSSLGLLVLMLFYRTDKTDICDEESKRGGWGEERKTW